MTPTPQYLDPEINRAQATKHMLLTRISEATDRIERLKEELAQAQAQRVITLLDAQRSNLTTPGERQSAARISKQHRQTLEARQITTTNRPLTEPLPGVDNQS